jgi:hypothetical protein
MVSLADALAHGLLVGYKYDSLVGNCLGCDDILLLRNQWASVMNTHRRELEGNPHPNPIDPCCRTTSRCSGRRFASSEIGPFLKAGFGSTVFPIYDAAPLNGKPFGGVRSSTARSRLEFKEIGSTVQVVQTWYTDGHGFSHSDLA